MASECKDCIASIIDDIISQVLLICELKPKEQRKRKRSNFPVFKQTKLKEDKHWQGATIKLKRKARRLRKSNNPKCDPRCDNSVKLLSKLKAIDKWWSSCAQTNCDQKPVKPINASHITNPLQVELTDQNPKVLSYKEFCQQIGEENSFTSTSASAPESINTSSEDVFLLHLHQQLSNRQQQMDQLNKEGDLNTSVDVEGPHAMMDTDNNTNVEMMQDLADPKMLSIEVVMQMFNDLKLKVDAGSQGIEDLKKQMHGSSSALAQAVSVKVGNELQGQLNTIRLQQDARIQKLEEKLEQQGKVNEILTNTVDEMYRCFAEFEQRIENMELSSARNSVVISNFDCGQKKWEKIRDLYDMFNSYLNIEVSIDDVFPVGNQTPPNLVVVLQSGEDKRQLFRVKKLLKDYVTSSGKPCYINDYIPAATTEKRRRQEDIIYQNDKKDDSSKLNIQYAPGGIKIQNATYTKKVNPPTPKEVLEAATDRCDQIMKIAITAGQEHKKDGNRFVGFVTAAKSHKVIRDAYVRMKLSCPSAKHIICAYNLDGQEDHYCQDYHDNGDHGMARHVLSLMQQYNIRNYAVFVARFVSQTKIFSDRIGLYLKAAASAINNVVPPHNQIPFTDDGEVALQKEKRKRKTKPGQE